MMKLTDELRVTMRLEIWVRAVIAMFINWNKSGAVDVENIANSLIEVRIRELWRKEAIIYTTKIKFGLKLALFLDICSRFDS